MVKPAGAQKIGKNVNKDSAGNRYDLQNGKTNKYAKMVKFCKMVKPVGEMIKTLKQAGPQIGANGKMVIPPSSIKR